MTDLTGNPDFDYEDPEAMAKAEQSFAPKASPPDQKRGRRRRRSGQPWMGER